MVAACSVIRGRMRSYPSEPTCRIWPVGSTHLLAVANGDALPANIACGPGFEVYADFVLCPTVKRYGTTHEVCVDSASHLRASEVKAEDVTLH